MLKIIWRLVVVFVFINNSYALPNPAAVNCVKKQNQLVLLDNTGFCIFPDNSYCEEWHYFRGECSPGRFYWPETIVDRTNIKKYCVKSQNKAMPRVEFCNAPK